MPLMALLRVAFGLAALALLAAAGYLLWTWYDGYWLRDAAGRAYFMRDAWRLWAGGALLAWSLLGRLAVVPLLGRPDTDPTQTQRSGGEFVVGDSGATLYVERSGPRDGPKIILTHGWGLDSTIWYYARRALSQNFDVIVWDLPGLGRSSLARDKTVSLTDFAADLGSIMRMVDGYPVVLVGHSIGGMTIQTLARDNPALFARQVSGVVLVNTTYTNPLKTMILSGPLQALRWPLLEPLMRLTVWLQPLAWLGAWHGYLSGFAHMANRLGFGRYVTRSQLEQTTLLATRNPPGVQAKGNLAMFRWDVSRELASMAKPTLVIGGDLDIVTKFEASEYIANSIPNADLQKVDGVNHMGFLEQANEYNLAIETFATGLKS